MVLLKTDDAVPTQPLLAEVLVSNFCYIPMFSIVQLISEFSIVYDYLNTYSSIT